MANLPTKLANPLLTYNFLVEWDGKYVAAVTSVSGLTRRTQVVSFHAGGQPSAL
jgi:phage tail-like protein